jgi:hypothetical protein
VKLANAERALDETDHNALRDAPFTKLQSLVQQQGWLWQQGCMTTVKVVMYEQ